jgi:hypothetical protein
MTKQIMSREIKILFDEGPDKFDSFHKQQWGYSGFDESEKIRPHYMQAFCTYYTIKKPFSSILKSILKGDDFDENKEKLSILFRAGLIDENYQLTHRGHYKTISMLNFYDQIEHLGLPLDQLEQLIGEKTNPCVEDAAKKIYSGRYEFVVHDEGTLFEFIESCFIYSSRRYFVDYGFNPELLYSIRGNAYLFVQAIRQGILQGHLSTLKNVVRGCDGILEREDPKNNLWIAKKSISKAIREMNIEVLLEDAKQRPGLTNRIRGDAMDCLKSALRILGEDALRNIISKLAENPTINNKGWSDLTVFHKGQCIPIEVKRLEDKLKYSQIERLFWLYSNLPEHAKNQRVATPPRVGIP